MSSLPQSSNSHPSTTQKFNGTSNGTFAAHLSQQLEREIAEDEHDMEEYGGDDPHDPSRHHYTSQANTAISSPKPSIPLSTEDLTAVNTFTEHSKLEETESDIVTWDGPNDPENPQNFSFRKKVFLTGVIILLTINVTLASSAPSTATVAIAREFGVSDEAAILVTSLFLVGYVVGPLFWSGLSEMYGRRPVFNVTVLIFILFTLGQALGKNFETILVTRFLSGFFAAAPLTNGGGFIADVWDPIGLGPAVAVFSAAVFIGPIMGPIMGSFVVASDLKWRWVFWILMMFAGFCWLVSLFCLPETFAPVLLQRKAEKLRKADPTGNANKYAEIERQDFSWKGIVKRTVFRPFAMLWGEPILVLATVYLAVVYGIIYALFELLPIVFSEIRGIKSTLTGLTFIGVGIGTTIGAYVYYLAGRKYIYLTPKWHGHPPAEERLPTAMIGGPLLAVAIFWLSWTGAYPSVPWYVVELSTIPLGAGIALIFMSFQSYIVDTYLMYSASALAGNSVFRSAMGAGFPLFTNQMFNGMGTQWAGTLLGCIALLLAPMPFVFYKYGAQIRTRSKFAPCLDLKIRDEVLREEKEKQDNNQMA